MKIHLAEVVDHKKGILLILTITCLAIFAMMNSSLKKSTLEQRKQQDEMLVFIEEDNPKVLKAKQEAQASLDDFINKFKNRSQLGLETYSIKTFFGEGENTEHMWVRVNSYQDRIFYELLANTPYVVTDLHMYDEVEVKRVDIEDWVIRDQDFNVIEGGYSIELLMDKKL